VLASAVVLYVAGGAALWSLPASRPVSVALLLAWLAHGILACRCRIRAGKRVAACVLDATGALELVSPAGKRTAASRSGGTIVLERAIWLRYRDRDGRFGAELFTGEPRRDAEFRRAAVLLRLLAQSQNN
jgi:hypothetical protein